MWAVNSPPSARNPMTSTAPAVALRTVGSSQMSQTREARAAVTDDVLAGGSRSFMPEDPLFLLLWSGRRRALAGRWRCDEADYCSGGKRVRGIDDYLVRV